MVHTLGDSLAEEAGQLLALYFLNQDIPAFSVGYIMALIFHALHQPELTH
jgi:hypothetical protein